MAKTKTQEPKVGDPAIIRGRKFRIAAIGKSGSGVPVVTFHDAQHEAVLAAPRETANELPRGTKWHARLSLVDWVEGVEAWTVRGQFAPRGEG